MPKWTTGENGPCLEIVHQGAFYRAYPPDYGVFYRLAQRARAGKITRYEVRVPTSGRLGTQLQRAFNARKPAPGEGAGC
jgi:hypothetical protein